MDLHERPFTHCSMHGQPSRFGGSRSLVRAWPLACLSSVLVWGYQAEAAVTVTPVVHRSYPHDPQAFTQGLLFHQGQLFESTGLYGRSTLRRVDLATGEVRQSVALGATEFGEGLAQIEDRLVQLTWKSGVAHVYDVTSFEHERSFDYSGEGWGLCFDGKRLVMSDGSSSLFFRDPTTFEMTASVSVTRDGLTVRQLNELECVNGWVYANVWQTKQIVKIDPTSGIVVATILVDGLLSSEEAANADVLNGIAYLPETARFYITGKLWPKLFEVDFPDAAGPTPGPSGTSSGGDSSTDASRPATNDAETGAGTGSSNDGAATRPPASPPKVQSGCHCATVGAAANATLVPPVGGGALSVWSLLALCRRARRRGVRSVGRRGDDA